MIERDNHMSQLAMAMLGDPISCPKQLTEKLIDGLTMDQIDDIARAVCGRCITGNTCNMYKRRHDATYKMPIRTCSIVKRHLSGSLPKVVCGIDPAVNRKLPETVVDILEKAQDKAFETLVEQMNDNPDAIEALYGSGEKPMIELAVSLVNQLTTEAGNPPEDGLPDLSGMCGQATEYPCEGCCKNEECLADAKRPDSAEIDHSDPINQGDISDEHVQYVEMMRDLGDILEGDDDLDKDTI
jgi:hypothetical protein